MKTYYVYILASGRNGTLYIGVTNDLERRLTEHWAGTASRFTTRYGVNRLVWYEHGGDIGTMIAREKELKRFRRANKIALIESANPSWCDLARDWFKRSEI